MIDLRQVAAENLGKATFPAIKCKFYEWPRGWMDFIKSDLIPRASAKWEEWNSANDRQISRLTTSFQKPTGLNVTPVGGRERLFR